jgi:hypothetical protein
VLNFKNNSSIQSINFRLLISVDLDYGSEVEKIRGETLSPPFAMKFFRMVDSF